MYPIPKVHWNHEFLTYIIIIKGCYWKIKSVNKDLPLISNRIQSMHEIIIVFQKRNNDQIWKPANVMSQVMEGPFTILYLILVYLISF